MAAAFELKRTADNQYMFDLKAPNYETILTSERYATKMGAQGGIQAVRTNTPLDARYNRRVPSNG